jgi:hypothetical protein
VDPKETCNECCYANFTVQVLGISEAKQALLTEAAQQHQQQQQHQHRYQHQQQQQQQGEAAAAAAAPGGSLGDTAMLAGEEEEEVGSELEDEEFVDADLAMPGDIMAAGDTWVTPLQGSDTQRSRQQQRRRRRSSSGAGTSVSAAGAAAGAAATAAAAAPTTLQSVAPRKEAVGKEEVVGLLAAVMKQRGGRG